MSALSGFILFYFYFAAFPVTVPAPAAANPIVWGGKPQTTQLLHLIRGRNSEKTRKTSGMSG
jgi:hypothetical protein